MIETNTNRESQTLESFHLSVDIRKTENENYLKE